MYLVHLTRNTKTYTQWEQEILDSMKADYINDDAGFLEHDPDLSIPYQRALTAVEEAAGAIAAYFAALVKKEGEWIKVLSDLRDGFRNQRGMIDPDPKS